MTEGLSARVCVEEKPARPGQARRQKRHEIAARQGQDHETGCDGIESDLGNCRHQGLHHSSMPWTCQPKGAEL